MPTSASPVRESDLSTRWDLSEIFPDDAAWRAALEDLRGRTRSLDRFRGRLDADAATLAEAFGVMFDLRLAASRLGAYAGMRSDEDTREAGPQGMRDALRTVLADLGAATAWVDPELLEIPAATLAGFVEREPALAPYARYLERLEKRRPHVLDAESERLLGMTRRIRGSGATIGGLLRDAEIPWPEITLANGDDVRVDAAGFSRLRQSPDRPTRVAAYEAFYATLQSFRRTLAAALSTTVQEHVLTARVRDFPTTLDAALADSEVDPAVYRMLVDEIGAALPTLHRYLRLRGRMLDVDDLRYHDMYPPLVGDVSSDYSWERSRALVLESLAPLGDEYVERFRTALDSRWVDVYPRPGKRSGAYVQDAAYGVHPFMLLNHQDDYMSASTLAHEGGHLMHSWYSQEAQPYATSDYEIFVAEVASTLNEVLLFEHLVAGAEDEGEKLALLGNFLEGLRTTVFRQTMFAEFELTIHEAAERGEPITGDALNDIYGGLLRRYHGHEQGVVTIDDAYLAEWAWVPHFHYNFYVYQYATSYVAALALAEAIREDRPGARDAYLRFLRGGSSLPPVDLLREAGIDMTSPEPIRAAVRRMDDVLERIERIVGR